MWTERGPREVGVQRYWMVCNSEHVPMEVASLCQGWFKAIGVLVSPEHSLLSFWWQQSLTVTIPVYTLGKSRRHGLNRTDHPMYSIYNVQSSGYNTIQTYGRAYGSYKNTPLTESMTIWWRFKLNLLTFNKLTFTQLLYFIFESLTMPNPSRAARNPNPNPSSASELCQSIQCQPAAFQLPRSHSSSSISITVSNLFILSSYNRSQSRNPLLANFILFFNQP